VRRAPAAPAELEPIERASEDELRSLQLRRLKATLRQAYERVPFYRSCMAQAGVHPDDLRVLEDLARFPLLEKARLREHYPFGLLAVPRTDVLRVHASSGTTGQPTIVAYTRGDLDTWADLVARSIRAAGGRRGDLVHIAYGYGLFTGGLGAHAGAERLGCAVVPASGGQTERQARLIVDLQPDILMATPSYALVLAEELCRLGVPPAATALKIGIFGAEPWTEALRDELEASLGIDALDIYGLSEIMGPGVASECLESKQGPTLWEDHFYPEIIDPDTGLVLPDGEQGELVLTTLTREALPMIRYRTRDRTRLLPPTARAMRRLERICGRTDDMLIVRGVNVFPSEIEAHILATAGLAPHYLIELSRAGSLDVMTVRVEATPLADAPARSRAAAALAHHLKSSVGLSTTVRVEEPGSLERSAGKARRVLDRRGT
jgi:phenylacetate-CoA ligase